MRALIILVLLLAVVPAHAGKYRTITCKGRIGIGSTDSGIYGLENDCGWLTRSKIASQILKKCDVLDDCEIVGHVDDQNFFVKILAVRRVRTATEPPVTVLKEAACRASMPWMDDCDISGNSMLLNVIDVTISARENIGIWSYTVNLTYKESTKVIQTFNNVRFSIECRNGVWHILR